MKKINYLKKKFNCKSGFTLLEIIIVIIVIAILASLAMPRYIKTVEYARGLEALIQLGTVRQSLNRYYTQSLTYQGATLDNLDVENPNNVPLKHFDYTITITPPDQFELVATRNTFDNGDPASSIHMWHDGKKTGSSGVYAGIR